MHQMEKTVMWLSDILQDQAKRKALFQLRGCRAQSLIDGLNYYISDPEFRRAAKPWVLKHTVIALRRLCEVSTLYPTCYVLGPIQRISPKGGGGFCDISQGFYRGQFICLKVVRLYQDSNVQQLLKAHAREAILWSQLDHPNIVPFYGIFYLERKERICLVSPWMGNGDVVDYLQRVPKAPRMSLIRDIANGLQYLHVENIVHGDLKGRNILIDNHQRARLTDFGLSTIVTDETLGFAKTTTGTLGHTTRWISPELLEDDARPTRESDVWAFGCVCYEVLTGLTPFAGCSEANVIRKLVMGEVPARLDETRLHPNEVGNKTWSQFVGWCWSIDTKQRPGCAEILKRLGGDSSARQPGLRRSHPSTPSNRNWLKVPRSAENLDMSRKLLEELYHVSVSNARSLQRPSSPPINIKPEDWEEVVIKNLRTGDDDALQELLVHTDPDLIMPLHRPCLVTQLVVAMLIDFLSQVVDESQPSDEAFKNSLRWLRHAVVAFNPGDKRISGFGPRVVLNVQQVLLEAKQGLLALPGPSTNGIVRDISDIDEILRLKVAPIL